MNSPPIPTPSPTRGEGGEDTAIFGIGSPFGEDQAGWEALEQFSQQAWATAAAGRGELTVEKLDRSGMALLELMRGFGHVILVDAVLTSEHPPGTLLPLAREELALLAAPASTHGFGVAETLAMGEALGLLPKCLEIWGVVVNPTAYPE